MRGSSWRGLSICIIATTLICLVCFFSFTLRDDRAWQVAPPGGGKTAVSDKEDARRLGALLDEIQGTLADGDQMTRHMLHSAQSGYRVTERYSGEEYDICLMDGVVTVGRERKAEFYYATEEQLAELEQILKPYTG